MVGHNHLVVAWVMLATWAGGVGTSQATLGPGRGRQADHAHAARTVLARVAGIHGTNEPWLTPGRPSHGCVRVRKADITRLYRLVQIGRPLRII